MGPELVRTRDHYLFPPLKKCREKFARMMQSEIKWEEPDVEWKEADPLELCRPLADLL